MSTPWFVWVPGLNGPCPEIWHEGRHLTREGHRRDILAKHVLPPEQANAELAWLIAHYPAPGRGAQ